MPSHRRPSARGSSDPSRPWRPPGLLPLALLSLPLAWLYRWSHDRTAAVGYGWLDPAAIEFELPAEWTDPRWEDRLRATIVDFGPVALDDGRRLGELRRRLEALPFVATSAAPRVVWPAGVDFPLRLRRPVACVPVELEFLAVDADGVVLPGVHPRPPRVGEGYLPVIGPIDGRFDRVRAGERLGSESDRDALAIAASMWRHLPGEARRRFGRAVIDARRAAQGSVEEPGAVIALEGARAIWFGRSPRLGLPGELPLERKWTNVASGLERLGEGAAATGEAPRAQPWVLLDARWDVPDFYTADQLEDGS